MGKIGKIVLDSISAKLMLSSDGRTSNQGVEAFNGDLNADGKEVEESVSTGAPSSSDHDDGSSKIPELRDTAFET